MLPDQSFDAGWTAHVLLSVRKDSRPSAPAKCCPAEKMSFIHLFLQCIECLSYSCSEIPLLIYFPRQKSLRNLTKIRKKS